jgi:cysteine synthase
VPLRILVRPGQDQYSRFHEQYEALAEDLEGEGVLVRVLPAADAQAHVALPPSIWENGAEDYDLVIQVGSTAGEIVGTARLVEFVQRRLRGHERQGMAQSRANIYFATGEKHEFGLDAGE